MCRDRCTNACDISYPYRQIYLPYYWFRKLSKFYIFTFCRLWGQHDSGYPALMGPLTTSQLLLLLQGIIMNCSVLNHVYWIEYRCLTVNDVLFSVYDVDWCCRIKNFGLSGFKSTSEIWKVAHCFWALNHDRWAQNMWYFIYSKKSNLASFLFQIIPKKSLPVSLTAYWKKNL